MSTPADRIRRALGFCHRRFWSQKIKDAIKDAASALAELEREAAKWERLHDELYAEIASEHRRDEYGETETAAECIRRVVRKRDELRARLAEYEQAPTIGVIRDVGSRPYCDWKVSQATLPKSGAEIIARPTRKGE